MKLSEKSIRINSSALKTVIFIIVFIGCSDSSMAQGKNATLNKASNFNRELSWFIDTVNRHYKNSSPFLVYVAKIYDDSCDKMCFTLGFILNSNSLATITANYIYALNNKKVLVAADEDKSKRLIETLALRRITENDVVDITQTLFPSESGGFTYRGKGLTYCQNGAEIEKQFYKNEDEIPFEKSIHGKLPLNIRIEKISGD